jgi:hypothetical protein
MRHSNAPVPRDTYYIRPRVGAVQSHPVPGTYDGPLHITLSSELKDAAIIFTRDMSVPCLNSDREHGFRCEHYSKKGIVLDGKGTHVITVVAHKEGYIETPAIKFKFTLRRGQEEPKSLSRKLRDAVMDRQFAARATINPAMPFLHARRQTDDRDVTFALADTHTRRALQLKCNKGADIALFQLDIPRTVASRETFYRRIITPSMNLDHSEKPNTPQLQTPPLSLRSNAPFAQRSYDAPAYAPQLSTVKLEALEQQRPGTSSSLVPYSKPGSRAVTPATVAGRTSTPGMSVGRRGIRAPSARTATPSTASRMVQRPSTSAIVSAQSQLCWFESRVRQPASESDDKVDVADETAYRERCTTVVNRDAARLAAVSDSVKKSYCTPLPGAPDVAGDGRKLLAFMMTAADATHSTLNMLLGTTSFQRIADSLKTRPNCNNADLQRLSEERMSLQQGDDLLRRLLQSPTESRPSYATKLLLLLLRYVIWTSRSMPEAIFGLVLNFLKDDNPRPVTRLEVITMIEAYRRTRGHSVPVMARLREACQQLKWDNQDAVELSVVVAMCRAEPVVDAALLDMGNEAHFMYSSPLRAEGH